MSSKDTQRGKLELPNTYVGGVRCRVVRGECEGGANWGAEIYSSYGPYRGGGDPVGVDGKKAQLEQEYLIFEKDQLDGVAAEVEAARRTIILPKNPSAFDRADHEKTAIDNLIHRKNVEYLASKKKADEYFGESPLGKGAADFYNVSNARLLEGRDFPNSLPNWESSYRAALVAAVQEKVLRVLAVESGRVNAVYESARRIFLQEAHDKAVAVHEETLRIEHAQALKKHEEALRIAHAETIRTAQEKEAEARINTQNTLVIDTPVIIKSTLDSKIGLGAPLPGGKADHAVQGDFSPSLMDSIRSELNHRIAEVCSNNIGFQLGAILAKEGNFGPVTQGCMRILAKADSHAFVTKNPAASLRFLLSDQAQNPLFNIDDARDQLSGKVFGGTWFTPIEALAHSIWGDGKNVVYPIGNIGLSTNFQAVSQVSSAIQAAPVGSSRVDINFAYATATDSFAAQWTLGNITLRLQGDLTKGYDGTWTFDGSVRAFQDTYDANASTHRSWLGEQMTTVLRALEQKNYKIDIPGELKVEMTGG